MGAEDLLLERLETPRGAEARSLSNGQENCLGPAPGKALRAAIAQDHPAPPGHHLDDQDVAKFDAEGFSPPEIADIIIHIIMCELCFDKLRPADFAARAVRRAANSAQRRGC